MSRTIDRSVPLDELSEEDLRYLHSRNEITDEQLAQALDTEEDDVTDDLKNTLSAGTPLEEVAETGDANTAGLSREALEKKLDRMAKEQGTSRSSTGVVEDDEDDDEDDLTDVPYTDKRWTNDRLRAELAERELSVEGNKQQMIARLERDDEE